MKKAILIFSLLVLILSTVFCQPTPIQSKFVKSVDILAGFVPSQDYDALKFDLAVSNILFKVVGFYTSFEVGVTSDYFSNIWGINVSVLRFLYLFGGLDLFTSYGVIGKSKNENTNGVRKELGIGLFPVKNLTLRGGFSLEVGVTVTVGYRIPFGKNSKQMNRYKGFINRW